MECRRGRSFPSPALLDQRCRAVHAAPTGASRADRARINPEGGVPAVEQRAQTPRPDRVIDVSKGGGRRHRRPTGAPPPLPKKIGWTGALRLALLVLIVLPGCIWLHVDPAALDRFDDAITDAVVSLRVGWLDAVARSLNTVGSRWGLGLLMLCTIAGVAWFKRWRHLAMFLISVALSGLVAQGLLLLASRPRPFDVTIIGSWEGFSAPSLPMGGLAVAIVGILYMLIDRAPADVREVRRRRGADPGGVLADLPRDRPLHRRAVRPPHRRVDPGRALPRMGAQRCLSGEVRRATGSRRTST